MDIKLTNDELATIDTLMLDLKGMATELPVWTSEPVFRKGKGGLPLEHEAAAESFLVAELEGRARLSRETRLREEARLALKMRKRNRKRHVGACRGRRHWKRKEQTRQRMLDRKYDEDAYVWFMKANKRPVDCTRDEWNRWLAVIFDNHPRGSLTWSRPNASRAYSVYNLKIVYKPLDARGKPKPTVVVYDGADSLIWDAQHPEHAERVMYLAQKKKPPAGEAM